MEEKATFESLGLSPRALAVIAAKGFEEPTRIQSDVIPLLLADECDIIGQSQTGTGKTAAFALPLIEKLEHEGSLGVGALVLVPTRELAIQVAAEINSLKGPKSLIVAPFYGGQSYETQFRLLKRGTDIVVGTPGRIIDHLDRKTLDLSKARYVVLDEADEMLDMGFIDDVERILSSCTGKKRTLLFSATMPQRILSIANKFMPGYKLVSAGGAHLTTDLTDQIYFEVREGDKLDALARIIDFESEFYSLVFCRTKNDTENVAARLSDRGYDAEALNGDMSQQQREKIVDRFRKKLVTILVATDVAARGIDIEGLTHVINYALPQDPESYVHRIGRTGRAGHQGTAVTFVTPSEYRSLMIIQKVSRSNIRREKLPSAADIISLKKTRMLEEAVELIGSPEAERCRDMAEALVRGEDPVGAVAAMIRYAFEDAFDEKRYGAIREGRDAREARPDSHGRARLCVALGRKDGMTRASLVELIKTRAGTWDRKIDNVEVFETCSFLSVPFEEAEMILKKFRSEEGLEPLVKRAGPEAGGGQPDRGGREGYDRGGARGGYRGAGGYQGSGGYHGAGAYHGSFGPGYGAPSRGSYGSSHDDSRNGPPRGSDSGDRGPRRRPDSGDQPFRRRKP
jgi:ATP-dependent RNA helicase DeaD